jgi:hypothetical protein
MQWLILFLLKARLQDSLVCHLTKPITCIPFFVLQCYLYCLSFIFFSGRHTSLIQQAILMLSYREVIWWWYIAIGKVFFRSWLKFKSICFNFFPKPHISTLLYFCYSDFCQKCNVKKYPSNPSWLCRCGSRNLVRGADNVPSCMPLRGGRLKSRCSEMQFQANPDGTILVQNWVVMWGMWKFDSLLNYFEIGD